MPDYLPPRETGGNDPDGDLSPGSVVSAHAFALYVRIHGLDSLTLEQAMEDYMTDQATVTPRQVELFHKLTTDREFPAGADVEALRAEFAGLNKASASAWIDRAMNLPKSAQDGAEPITPPKF